MVADESSKPVKNSETFKLELIGDKEIRMSRVFDAPKHLVFLAHTTCDHMKRWWGPRSTEFVECDIDFNVGGKWRIKIKTPEGQHVAFFGEYREIVKNERITWTFGFDGAPGDPAVETMTLEESGGRTTLTAVSTAPSKEARDAIVESGMEWGARETWDRLEEQLEGMKPRG